MTLLNRIRLTGWLAVFALGGLATVAVAVDKDKPASAPSAKLSAVELDQKIMAEIKDRSEIMKNLGYISDVIGHRLTGSASLKRANEWTAEVMKSYGLENVHLEPWEIPIGWQRGHVSMTLKTPREQVLLACSAGWSPSTKGKVTGPVVVLDVTKKEDLEKYRGKLKNAIVLQSRPSTVPQVKDAVYRRPAQITPPAATPPATPPMPKPAEAAAPPAPTTSAIKDGDDQPPATPTTPATPAAPMGDQPPRRAGFGEGGLGLMQAISDFAIRASRTACSSPPAAGAGLTVKPRPTAPRACSWPTSTTPCFTAWARK
jgi:carboxypeptidase Q